jgi:DNA-binding NtrC family response regulator
MKRVLLIEDHDLMRESIEKTLSVGLENVVVEGYAEATKGIQRLSSETFQLVITDYKLPDMDGLKVLQEVKRRFPELPVIIITAYGTIHTAVQAMKQGAYDFIEKPFKPEALEVLVKRAMEHKELTLQNEYLRTRLEESQRGVREAVWGPSRVMRQLYETVQKVGPSESTVLITGESGVGKEVVAQAIHMFSPRSSSPFLCVNCAALSAGLLESELFGHEKGAFTGADRLRKGRFELAEGGTLLLDEVSEIDTHLQAKLLRVLHEKSYERVGSSQTRRANVRVISTTNRDLREEIVKGRFREDLYYRLNVIPIHVPPLREHKEDIPGLVSHFLWRFGVRETKPLSPELLELFFNYNWPGNVRELANIIERALVLSSGRVLDERLIEPWLSEGGPVDHQKALKALVGVKLQDVEKGLIQESLLHTGGNKQRAAELLGITPRTLRNKLKEWENTSKEGATFSPTHGAKE